MASVNLIVFWGIGGALYEISAHDNYLPFKFVFFVGIFWIYLWDPIYKYFASNILSSKSLAVPSATAHHERRFRTYPSAVCNTWYHFVDSNDLKVGSVIEYRALGRVFVLWRGEDGKPVCQDAFCLHQGANMGLGGKVEGNCIVCPFHMWKFAGDGTIMEVPYLKDPSSCQSSARKQKTYRCMDWCGLLLVYFHAEDKEPEFSPPEFVEKEFADEKWEPHIKWDSGFFTFTPIDIVDQAADHMHFNTIHTDFMLPWTTIRLPKWLLRVIPLGISHECVTYLGSEKEWVARVKETGWGVVDRFLLYFTDNAGLTWGGKMMETTKSLTMELFLGPAIYILTIPFTIGTLKIFLTVTPTDGGSALRMRTWIDHRTANNFFIKSLAWILTGISASQLNADVSIIENKIRLRKPMIQPYDGPYNRVNTWLKQFYSENTKDIFDCDVYKNDW